ncbi:MAG: IPT/TIG domain-containing protein [Gemmatimonadetes bacterium]|nr:IPT/TIG domain-containing protein [Gemmatimonadota bacterium]
MATVKRALRLGAAAVAAGLLACGGGGGPTDPAPRPRITDLEPDPVRAGEALTIHGQDFQAVAGRVPAPLPEVTVVLDGRVLTPVSVTDTEIVITVPLEVAPGDHSVVVRAGDSESDPRSVGVTIFTVTGSYAAVGVQTEDTCEADEVPVGGSEPFSVSLVDERPVLGIRVDGFDFEGTLASDGTFAGTHEEVLDPEVGLTGTVEFEGTMGAREGGTAGLTAVFEIQISGGAAFPACVTRWSLDGTRVADTPGGPGNAAGPVNGAASGVSSWLPIVPR